MKFSSTLPRLIAAVSLVISGCAAQPQHSAVAAPAAPLERQITVAAGKTARLTSTFSVKDDCTFDTYNEIRVIREPEHGVIDIRKAMAHPDFAANNPRSACNGIKVPGTFAKYTPDDDFTGVDHAVIEIVTADGKALEAKLSITVK